MGLTRNFVLLVLLTGLAFLLFWSVIDSFFMGETLEYLGPINKRVLFHNLWGDTSWMSAHYARCAVRTMWGLERRLFGQNPVGYHIVNILFHIANSLLAFLLLKRILGSDRSGLVASAFASLIFLVHHGSAENVRWITERWDLSMCLFYVLALLLFMRYKRRTGRPYLLALSVASFAISLCSKEMAFSFPIMILVYDFYYLSGLKKVWPLDWRRVLVHLPFWVTALLYFAYRFARYTNIRDYRAAVKGTHTLLESVATYFAWFAYPFGIWGAIGVFLLALVFGGRRLRFLTLFVLIALIPVSRIPEVWRGYLPTFGFSMLWGAILTRNWVELFSNRWRKQTTEPASKRLIILMRLVQGAFFAIIIAANVYATHRDNLAWRQNTTKEALLARQVKADHPELPPGTEIYVVNVESGPDKLLKPCYFPPPLVFMYDETRIEGFSFQQFYSNRTRAEVPSPDRLYVYVLRGQNLQEDTDLKSQLLKREASFSTNATIELLTDKVILPASGQRSGLESCLALEDLRLCPEIVNTIQIRMVASAETDLKSTPGELRWQAQDKDARELSASVAEFEVIPDGTDRTYRLGVGAFASWVFAQQIDELTLCFTRGDATIRITSVEATQKRFQQTDEKKPDWEGFDDPLHFFAMPRYMRLPEEKLDYFLYADQN